MNGIIYLRRPSIPAWFVVIERTVLLQQGGSFLYQCVAVDVAVKRLEKMDIVTVVAVKTNILIIKNGKVRLS